MLSFLFSLLLDAIVAASFTFGVMLPDERLINIGYFAGWFFGLLTFVGFFSEAAMASAQEHYRHRCLARRVYDVLTDAAMVIFSAWSGWYVLAGIYGLGAVLKAQFVAGQEKRLVNAVRG